MTTINIDPRIHDLIQPNYNCRNGMLVSPTYQGELAAQVNQIARLRPKELASFDGGAQARTQASWHFATHVSPLASAIAVRALMAKSLGLIGAYADVQLVNGSGAEVAYGRMYGGYAVGETPSDVPDEWTVQTLILDASAFRNTSIRGRIWTPITGSGVGSSEYSGRMISATIYEWPLYPDTINGYVAQQYSLGQGIYDTDRSAVQALARDLWKYGAGPVFNFSSQTNALAPVRTSATAVNLIDSSSTTVTSETPGFFADLRYCNTKLRTTVPCRFEVYAGYTGAGAGTVRLVDSTGTTLASHAITGAAAWYQTTVNLPPTNAKYDLHHLSDGANVLTTYAASVYQYLA